VGDALLGGSIRPAQPDPSRLILWAPVALGAGAAFYFVPKAEPPAITGLILCAAGLGLGAAALWFRSKPVWLYCLTLTAIVCLGFSLAQYRTYGAAPPPIEAPNRAVTVEGWIEAVERSGSRPRLRVRVVSFDDREAAPKRIRVRAALGAFTPGDAIRVGAVLNPPPGPAAPGGYDPARAAWFDQIALTGYAVTPLSASEQAMNARWERGLAKLRWRLAERIRDKAGPRTGGVAAALLTGDRSGVDEADAEALRLSGLGHILAISGLHMALFAGGVYFAVRYALAAIEPFARAHDPRRPAASIALFAATGYLILSGAAIPTQRAWVMAGVVLIGVMLDRRALSLRALALAALAVLILAPESVVEPGFQMSFAAVAALIAVYEAWGRLRPTNGPARGLAHRFVQAFAGLSTTSLVAGAATGAFAAFHFQRMAAYGLFANLAAMPIFTFWVMPAGVVALALAPLGLEGPALQVMDLGLRLVLGVAHWTAEQRGAGVSVLAANGAVIAFYGAGFAAMTIGLGLVRLSGGVICAVALGLWAFQTAPDLMVTEDGVVIAQFEQKGQFQATNLRRSRFDAGVFLQRAGQGGGPLLRAPLRCDSRGCFGETQSGVQITITDDPETLAEDCSRVDLVVFSGVASPWRRRRCEALLLDDAYRAQEGGVQFEIRSGRLAAMSAANDDRRARIWTRPRAP
jgi:competence protein ComEC